MTFGKDLLLAAETGLPGGKYSSSTLPLSKPDIGPQIEAERPCGQDQVCALQGGIPLGGHLDQLGNRQSRPRRSSMFVMSVVRIGRFRLANDAVDRL